MEVDVRDGRRDDALRRLQSVEHDAAVAEGVQRGPLPDVADAAAALDEPRDFTHARVGAVPRLERSELVHLRGVAKHVRKPGLPAAVAREQLLVRHRADVRVPVAVRAERLPHERVEQIRETENLRAVPRQRRPAERGGGERGTVRGPRTTLRARVPITRRRHRRFRVVSQERAHGDVQVSHASVDAPEGGFSVFVPLVREVGSEDEEEAQHDGDAEVAVEVEREVALLRARDVLAARDHLRRVREEPDQRGEDDLRDDVRDDGVGDGEDLEEKRQGPPREVPGRAPEDDPPRPAQTSVRGPAGRAAGAAG